MKMTKKKKKKLKTKKKKKRKKKKKKSRNNIIYNATADDHEDVHAVVDVKDCERGWYVLYLYKSTYSIDIL